MTARAATAIGSARPPASTSAWAERHVVRVLTLDLLLVVAAQKVAIPLAGREAQIASAFLIHGAMLAYLLARGLARLSAERAALLATMAAVIALTQPRLAPGIVSLPSMVLMLATSALLVAVIPLTRTAHRAILRRFVTVACAAGGLVCLDWATQFAGLGMPDLEAFIPHEFNYFEYNYVQPLYWGSPWMKPNGVFFLETSHVSQFIALGLVVEVALFRRIAVAAFLGTTLAATYGVTGMLIAGSSLPFLALRLRPAAATGLLIAVPLLLFAAAQTEFLDAFTRRAAEFSQSSSSGYNRFVLPAEWSAAALTGEADPAWLGTGAGSMPKALNDDETGVAGLTWPPYTKVGVEYGGIALALWLLFIAVSLFGQAPFVVSWAAFVQYAFLNGSLNVPIHTVYCCLLCAGYALTAEGAGSDRPRPVDRRPRALPVP